MKEQINTMFSSYQNSMFESGLAAQIGGNALLVWLAIKSYANLNTGVAWPAIRTIAVVTGLSKTTVEKALNHLEELHMLKIVRGDTKTSNRYVARERLDVRIGNIVVCTIVADYIPTKMRDTLKIVKNGLNEISKKNSKAVELEIIPADGFEWDSDSHKLVAKVDLEHERQKQDKFQHSALGKKVAELKKKALNK